MSFRSLFGLLLLLIGLPASGASYQVSASGVFDANASSTAFPAYYTANGAFAFSFFVDANPVVTNYTNNESFSPVISPLTYTLNGSTTTYNTARVIFFADGRVNGLEVCFTNTCPGLTGLRFNLYTAQPLFTGPDSAPTIVPGSYALTSDSDFRYGQFASVSNLNIQPAVTPEPSSLVLLGTGLVGVCGIVLRRLV